MSAKIFMKLLFDRPNSISYMWKSDAGVGSKG